MSPTPRARVVTRKKPRATVTRNAGSDPAYSKVYLMLHRVECLKTTKEILKKDEIVVGAAKIMGAVAKKGGKKLVVAKGKAGKTIYAGKFNKKKHNLKNFRPAKVLAAYPYGGQNKPWPRHYPGTVLLVEKDKGAIGTVVNQVINAIDEKAVKLATTAASGVAAGATIGTAIPVPLVGTAAGAAAGAITSVTMAAIKKARAHDVIGTLDVQANLKSAPKKGGTISNSKRVLNFKGQGGHYRVTISWEVR